MYLLRNNFTYGCQSSIKHMPEYWNQQWNIETMKQITCYVAFHATYNFLISDAFPDSYMFLYT